MVCFLFSQMWRIIESSKLEIIALPHIAFSSLLQYNNQKVPLIYLFSIVSFGDYKLQLVDMIICGSENPPKIEFNRFYKIYTQPLLWNDNSVFDLFFLQINEIK